MVKVTLICKNAYLGCHRPCFYVVLLNRDTHFWISDGTFPTRKRAYLQSLHRSALVGTEATRDSAKCHSPRERKAGRLGNDRPSSGTRLGCGYRSLGVCGKGLRKAAWGAAGGGRKLEPTLTNQSSVRHLQNRISTGELNGDFSRIPRAPESKIVENGHAGQMMPFPQRADARANE
jgi:hypothetical protein